MSGAADAFRGPDCAYCAEPTLVSEYAAVDVRSCLSGVRERREHFTFCSHEHLSLYFQEHGLSDAGPDAEVRTAEMRTVLWVAGMSLAWLLLAGLLVASACGLGYLVVTGVV